MKGKLEHVLAFLFVISWTVAGVAFTVLLVYIFLHLLARDVR